MRITEPADHDRDPAWLGRIGHIPDFMRRIAKAAQQVHFVFVGTRQLAAIADASHLRPAGLACSGCSGLTWNMSEVLGLFRIRHIDDRRPVVLLFSGERV